MKMKALFDKIICTEIKQEISKGGIIIPETSTAALPQCKCKVISVGEEIKTIKEGDVIFAHQRGGQVIALDAEHIFRIFGYNEVYCVVEE